MTLREISGRFEREPFCYDLLVSVAAQLNKKVRPHLDGFHSSRAMRRQVAFVLERLCRQTADLIERSEELRDGNADFVEHLRERLVPAICLTLSAVGSHDQDHSVLQAADQLLNEYYDCESNLKG